MKKPWVKIVGKLLAFALSLLVAHEVLPASFLPLSSVIGVAAEAFDTTDKP